jgi:hypothetical protein
MLGAPRPHLAPVPMPHEAERRLPPGRDEGTLDELRELMLEMRADMRELRGSLEDLRREVRSLARDDDVGPF